MAAVAITIRPGVVNNWRQAAPVPSGSKDQPAQDERAHSGQGGGCYAFEGSVDGVCLAQCG
jgi:hypothetical protein